jgi:hypothetical protein
MQDQAKNPFENFMAGKFLLKSLFGIIMQEEEYIEHAYRTFRKMGNIALATHCIKESVPDDLTIELPCNVEFIEAVSTGDIYLNNGTDVVYYFDGTQNLRPVVNQYYYPDILNDTYMNKVSLSRSDLHPIGQLVPYELIDCNRKLLLKEPMRGQSVNIIYRGQILDDEGLPCLSPKEVEAIAYYLAYIMTQKGAFQRDPGAVQLLPMIKQEADVRMAAAKIPEYVNQNFWDKVLSAKTRFDRKVFYNSYKNMQ